MSRGGGLHLGEEVGPVLALIVVEAVDAVLHLLGRLVVQHGDTEDACILHHDVGVC